MANGWSGPGVVGTNQPPRGAAGFGAGMAASISEGLLRGLEMRENRRRWEKEFGLQERQVAASEKEQVSVAEYREAQRQSQLLANTLAKITMPYAVDAAKYEVALKKAEEKLKLETAAYYEALQKKTLNEADESAWQSKIAALQAQYDILKITVDLGKIYNAINLGEEPETPTTPQGYGSVPGYEGNPIDKLYQDMDLFKQGGSPAAPAAPAAPSPKAEPLGGASTMHSGRSLAPSPYEFSEVGLGAGVGMPGVVSESMAPIPFSFGAAAASGGGASAEEEKKEESYEQKRKEIMNRVESTAAKYGYTIPVKKEFRPGPATPEDQRKVALMRSIEPLLFGSQGKIGETPIEELNKTIPNFDALGDKFAEIINKDKAFKDMKLNSVEIGQRIAALAEQDFNNYTRQGYPAFPIDTYALYTKYLTEIQGTNAGIQLLAVKSNVRDDLRVAVKDNPQKAKFEAGEVDEAVQSVFGKDARYLWYVKPLWSIDDITTALYNSNLPGVTWQDPIDKGSVDNHPVKKVFERLIYGPYDTTPEEYQPPADWATFKVGPFDVGEAAKWGGKTLETAGKGYVDWMSKMLSLGPKALGKMTGTDYEASAKERKIAEQDIKNVRKVVAGKMTFPEFIEARRNLNIDKRALTVTPADSAMIQAQVESQGGQPGNLMEMLRFLNLKNEQRARMKQKAQEAANK